MTTQTRKPAIIKETQIIVESTRLDDYGNLWVLDKNGDETKIAQKRSHLFPIFQPERGVNLYWAKYMDKLYVAEAQPLGDMINAPAEKPTLTTPTPDQPEIDASASKPQPKAPSKNAAFAVSYAKDLVLGDKVPLCDMIRCAEWIRTYLDGEQTIPTDATAKYVLTLMS